MRLNLLCDLSLKKVTVVIFLSEKAPRAVQSRRLIRTFALENRDRSPADKTGEQ